MKSLLHNGPRNVSSLAVVVALAPLDSTALEESDIPDDRLENPSAMALVYCCKIYSSQRICDEKG